MKPIFINIQTIINKKFVVSLPAKNEAEEFNNISTTCNHADTKVCFRKNSYLPSLNSLSSILSIYPFLLFI